MIFYNVQPEFSIQNIFPILIFFSQTAILKLFTDTSELSALPAGCIDYTWSDRDSFTQYEERIATWPIRPVKAIIRGGPDALVRWVVRIIFNPRLVVTVVSVKKRCVVHPA